MKGGPLEFLLLLFAGWVNRRQLAVIDYLKEENKILREHLHGRRLRFSDDQRRRLAVRGKALGRRMLRDLTGLLTPDTIVRWYRELIAAKYDGSGKRGPGRPRTAQSVQELVVQLTRENPGWGYTRLRDALGNLGHEIDRNTIKRIDTEKLLADVRATIADDESYGAPDDGQIIAELVSAMNSDPLAGQDLDVDRLVTEVLASCNEIDRELVEPRVGVEQFVEVVRTEIQVLEAALATDERPSQRRRSRWRPRPPQRNQSHRHGPPRASGARSRTRSSTRTSPPRAASASSGKLVSIVAPTKGGPPSPATFYLGRYTHRVGLSNSRPRSVDEHAVSFATKNGRVITLAPLELLRRFLLHVPPPGFVKIRHYGLWASGPRQALKLARARALLEAPVAAVSADVLVERYVPRCPVCALPLEGRPLSASLRSTRRLADTS